MWNLLVNNFNPHSVEVTCTAGAGSSCGGALKIIFGGYYERFR
ncbi:MAG: hypothetical protein PHY93_00090 [Bacteriovorax sp.]|nr:hypothetical protein [Bacteriovorax sp.]